MHYIETTNKQFEEFMAEKIDGPIHMLNMLLFKPEGGRESYAKYMKNTLPLLEARGGKIAYRADARATVIGGEKWDSIFIAEYPSRAAFVDMVASKEYQAGAHYRHDALVDSRLICMQVS